jgi:hypothetical protein
MSLREDLDSARVIPSKVFPLMSESCTKERRLSKVFSLSQSWTRHEDIVFLFNNA